MDRKAIDRKVKIFFLTLLILIGFESNIYAGNNCNPKYIIEDLTGASTEILVEQISKDILIPLQNIAQSGLPGYCGIEVTIQFEQGINLISSQKNNNKKTGTYYYYIRYQSPIYNVNIRGESGKLLHNLTFKNGDKSKTFFRADNIKSISSLEDKWEKEKADLLKALDIECKTKLSAFEIFINQFLGEYFVYTSNGYVPKLEQKVYPSEEKYISYKKKYTNEIIDKDGFLVADKLTIPISLKQGDKVTILSTGEIRKGEDRITPQGFSDSYQRSYKKRFKDLQYGRLLARVGYKTYDIGQGGSFTVESTDNLQLMLNAEDITPYDYGCFEAWVFLNDQLVVVPEPKGYISILEYPGGEFIPVHHSPDHSLILGINSTNELVLWRTSNGEILQRYKGGSEALLDYGFLSEEPILVTVSKDEKLNYWDILSGKLLKEVELSDDQIRHACFDPGMENIVFVVEPFTDPFRKNRNIIGSEIYQFNLYDLLRSSTPLKPKVLQKHQHPISVVSFLTYDNLLFSGDIQGNVHLWDMKNWKVKHSALYEGEGVKAVVSDPGTYSLIIRTIIPNHNTSYSAEPSMLEGKKKDQWFDLLTGAKRKSDQRRNNSNDFPTLIPHTGHRIIYLSRTLEYVGVKDAKGRIQLWNAKNYNK